MGFTMKIPNKYIDRYHELNKYLKIIIHCNKYSNRDNKI